MKIINKCVLPANKIYEVVCYKCHSTVEYEGREGKYRAGNRLQPATYTFDCPVCEYSNTMDMTRGREPLINLSGIGREDPLQKAFDKKLI